MADTKGTGYFEGHDDADKLRVELVPAEAIEDVARVLGFGAKKYFENGWKTLPDPEPRYLASLLRHVYRIQCGEEIDPDSGLPHIAHAATNAMFLCWFRQHRNRLTPLDEKKLCDRPDDYPDLLKDPGRHSMAIVEQRED